MFFFDFAITKQISFQDPAAPLFEGIINLHHTVFFYLVVILLLVLTISHTIYLRTSLLWERPSYITLSLFRKFYFDLTNLKHGTFLEIVWTIVPTFILISIVIPSFALLYSIDEVINPTITIKVIGHQWYWTYEFQSVTNPMDYYFPYNKIEHIQQKVESIPVDKPRLNNALEVFKQIKKEGTKFPGPDFTNIDVHNVYQKFYHDPVSSSWARNSLGLSYEDYKIMNDRLDAITTANRKTLLTFMADKQYYNLLENLLQTQMELDRKALEAEQKPASNFLISILINIVKLLKSMGSWRIDISKTSDLLDSIVTLTLPAMKWAIGDWNLSIAPYMQTDLHGSGFRDENMGKSFGLRILLSLNEDRPPIRKSLDFYLSSIPNYRPTFGPEDQLEMRVPITHEITQFNSYLKPLSTLKVGDLRLLEVDHPLVCPIKTHLRFIITSTDVIHSWAVPSLGIKVDAVPGRLNQAHVFIDRPGVFYGQCSELCGINHAFMPIKIIGI